MIDPVKQIYGGMATGGRPIGYCSEGEYAGWLFARNHDGQWVTIAKMPDVQSITICESAGNADGSLSVAYEDGYQQGVKDERARGEKWLGIGKLVEEQGELLQVLGKLITFPDGDHPDGNGHLIPRMEDELSDVGAACGYFIDINGLNRIQIEDRQQSKYTTFNNWKLTGIK